MTEDRAGAFTGVGRWVAVASELPCMVIVMLYLGQILGTSWGGSSGGTWGAVIGALVGFILGVLSVYKTIAHYEKMDEAQSRKKPYLPPMEEILEDVEFPLEEEE